MGLKYRISDNGAEIGPFDIVDVQKMFVRGSISNRALIRAHGTDESWQLITAQYPLWGKGRETAAPARKHQKLIADAAGPRKPRQLRSPLLGWLCLLLPWRSWRPRLF